MHLPRVRDAYRWLKSHVSGEAIPLQPLVDDVYHEALTSLIIATVDIMVMTEVDDIPYVVFGLARTGELAGKWTPFGGRMWRGDTSPQYRAQQVLLGLGLNRTEASFDPLNICFNLWSNAHYATVMMTLNLTAQEARSLSPNTKYKEISFFTLNEALQNPDVPMIYKNYIIDWRNNTLL